MRIPLRKIYRAFPELDRFSDERCERYVLQARQVARGQRLARHGTEFAVAAITFITVLAAGPSVLAGTRIRPTESMWTAMLLGYVAVLVSGPILASLVTRDIWLRRAIAARIDAARCPMCGYSLLGLPVKSNAVLCPECGVGIDLERHGLTVDDVLGSTDVPEVRPS